MRVTIVGLNYPPEVTGVAPYTAGLAEGLAAHGVSVRVVTGLPHYPEWCERAGYRGAPDTVENDVRVGRISHFVPDGHGLRSRLRMDLSFAARAAVSSWERPDVVLTVSPSLLASAAVVARARACGLPVGVIVHDLYGRGAAETGVLASAASALSALERGTLRSASSVSTIHDRFVESLAEIGVPRTGMRVIRNWTHVEVGPTSDIERSAIRTARGWSDDEIVVLHTGNMGLKQGLDSVVHAAAAADRDELPFRFVLVGDGNQSAHLRREAHGVQRIEFAAPVAESDYPALLRAADVLLVNELPGVAEMAVPSKLTSYFASGRPVLAATSPEGITASEVTAAGAGQVVPPGDPSALLAGVHALASDPAAARRYGDAGRAYATARLSAEHAIDAYLGWCRELAEGGRRWRTRV